MFGNQNCNLAQTFFLNCLLTRSFSFACLRVRFSIRVSKKFPTISLLTVLASTAYEVSDSELATDSHSVCSGLYP
jgi:hypothetical protein